MFILFICFFLYCLGLKYILCKNEPSFCFFVFFVVEKMWLKNYNTICRILAELCIDKLCKNEFPMDMCEWRDSVLYFQDYFKECLNLRFCSKCHILKWYFFFIHIIILHSIFLTVGSSECKSAIYCLVFPSMTSHFSFFFNVFTLCERVKSCAKWPLTPTWNVYLCHIESFMYSGVSNSSPFESENLSIKGDFPFQNYMSLCLQILVIFSF